MYIRSGSADVRVLRNIFSRGDYRIPGELIGGVSNIIDLGAYIGVSTAYFAQRYPRARVLAVEPDPDNYACLVRNAANLDADRVRIVRSCISNKKGMVRFDTSGLGWARHIVEDGGIVVPCLTIADLLEQHEIDRADILKMDIEGAERFAFEIADQWLNRVRWIMMEVHFASLSLSELVAMVSRHGRQVFFKASSPYPHWAEVVGSSHSQVDSRIAMLDVVIPPAGEASRLRSVQPYDP
ncbi:MAG: FkbM family methyltransferase [Candidatus Binatia bacterium]